MTLEVDDHVGQVGLLVGSRLPRVFSRSISEVVDHAAARASRFGCARLRQRVLEDARGVISAW